MASEHVASKRPGAQGLLKRLGRVAHLVSHSKKPVGIPRGQLYDALAQGYDQCHARWLRYAGGEAQSAVEGAVRALIGPHTDMLDAGCGTGAFIRRLLTQGFQPSRVTLLDASGEMLNQTKDLPVTRLHASMEKLPFADASFDLIACLWALETVKDQQACIRELFRVLKPGGWACFAFCADERPYSIAGHFLRYAIERRGTGRFLKTDEIIDRLLATGDVKIHRIPCRGPATALLCRRVDAV